MSKLTNADLVAALNFVEQAEGNVTQAAILAGIPRPTFKDRVNAARLLGLRPGVVIDPAAKLRAENTALKAQLRDATNEADTAAKIREEIWKISQHSPEPPTWLQKEGSNGARGMPMILASDWHYGEVVRPEELGGLNEFNADVAAKRIERMTSTAIELAFDHMGRANTKYPGAVLMYGGDMISGDIHDELAKTNDRTPIQCVNDLTDLMGAQVETLAAKFGRLHVPCVTGNHGRSTKRIQAKNRVFTSFEWNIYCNLAREFRRSKNITFQIPEQTDARFSVYGHRYLLTHGDMLGVKGGDGIIGALGPIRRGEIKVRNAESQIDQDFDTIVMGHWHQYITLPGLVVNNALKGYDEYARSFLRAPYSIPSQAMWFNHPSHGITAHWQIYLEKRPDLNKEATTLTWQE